MMLSSSGAYECTGYLSSNGWNVSDWRPRPAPTVWLEGRTETGRTVRIVGDPYGDERAEVWIDGKRATVRHASRKRDGGTTEVVTDWGSVHRPAPLLDRPSRLDGEVIQP